MPNPIIQRELFGMLRTRRAFAVQLTLVGVLVGLVLLMWPADATVELSGRQAQLVFRVFAYGLLAVLVLLAPVFPATSIVRERQQGTLALLLNSPMGPGSILVGKMVGVLGFVLLLIVLSVPVAAACYVMGGIDLGGQLLPVYAVLVLLSLQYGVLALLVSSYAGSTDSALRVTYGLVLLLAVVTMGPHQFMQGITSTASVVQTLSDGAASVQESLPGPLGLVLSYLIQALLPVVKGMDAVGLPVHVAADWLRCVSPIPPMIEAIGQTGVTGKGLIGRGDVIERFAILSVIITALCTLQLWRRLGKRLLDRPRAAGTMTEDRSAKARAYRRFMFLWFFDPQARSGLIQPGINPVMVKEFRCRRFGRGHWMMRIMAACVIISVGLMWAATQGTMGWGVPTLGGIMVLLQVALIVLVTPALASGMIAGERETGGWDLLRMTPMSAGRVLRGKFLAVLWVLFLLVLATLPGYLIMILIDEAQQLRVARVLVSLALTAAFAILLTAVVSSFFRRTAAATATAYALLLGLIAGTMLFWLAQDAPFTRTTVEAVLKFNPLAGALNLIEAPGFADYELVPGNWYVMGAGCAVCLVILSIQTWRLTRAQ